MAEKERLDVLLAKRDYYTSRSKAKRAIMAGKVYVNDQLIDKAGTKIKLNDQIDIRGKKIPYVSRGGLKLEKALKVFSLDPMKKDIFDIGASTGGFTDCLLQNGATKVYAIDVGYGQLAWKLRNDERVEVIERTNFRYLTPDDLSVQVPLIVTDVSFISLRLIIPAALKFLKENGQFVGLVKPQFEAGPERVGDKGVVKDKKVHIDVLTEISEFVDGLGLNLAGLSYSPITGASSKNIEFLLHLVNDDLSNNLSTWNDRIKKVVNRAHEEHRAK
jgi:23S rRNA (cytidine1920-2'-O)/16S rRNA (cytidine1409-2'-O)-methyltransferase